MIKERVGFVGLGNMGHGMAKNIVEKGWPLAVLPHRKRDAIEDLKGRGAVEVSSLNELAKCSDVIVLSLTGSKEVEQVIEGEGGVLSARKPLLIIDCSTSDPSSTKRLAAMASSQGVTVIDAPLTRTPVDSWNGTLDVMMGCDVQSLERARPIIDCFAQRIIHTGPVGTGHTMKLLNNFLSMGYAALYAEALMICQKSGTSINVFDSLLRGGRIDCAFRQNFFKNALEGDPTAIKFTMSNALKDLTYFAGVSHLLGVANPVGSAVRNSFAQAVGLGSGDDFVSSLSDVIAKSNGGAK